MSVALGAIAFTSDGTVMVDERTAVTMRSSSRRFTSSGVRGSLRVGVAGLALSFDAGSAGRELADGTGVELAGVGGATLAADERRGLPLGATLDVVEFGRSGTDASPLACNSTDLRTSPAGTTWNEADAERV